ncbi:MAG: recombinase family protein, partial [Clostridia bacterium]|nr:recombinase family protein [Clostridia bacterium]
GIKSPKGKDVWNESTVKSILTNEKNKGCALLQSYYSRPNRSGLLNGKTYITASLALPKSSKYNGDSA